MRLRTWAHIEHTHVYGNRTPERAIESRAWNVRTISNDSVTPQADALGLFRLPSSRFFLSFSVLFFRTFFFITFHLHVRRLLVLLFRALLSRFNFRLFLWKRRKSEFVCGHTETVALQQRDSTSQDLSCKTTESPVKCLWRRYWADHLPVGQGNSKSWEKTKNLRPLG